MKLLAKWINDAVENPENEQKLSQIREEVKEMCSKFPVPGI